MKDPSSSEEENEYSEEEYPTIEEIEISDILPYFDEEYVDDDPVVQKSINENRKRSFQLRINQLNKILPQLQEKWRGKTPLEYYLAYTMKNMDEQELFASFDNKTFLNQVACEAKMKMNLAKKPLSKKTKRQLQVDINRAIVESQKNIKDDSEDDSDSMSTEDKEDFSYNSYKSSYKKPSSYKHKKTYVVQEQTSEPRKKPSNVKRAIHPQTSTIPCPDDVSPEIWDSWSDAHKDSYIKQKENPNTYLYRNLPPGEKQKSGKWSKEETQLFLARLKEFREQGIKEGKWGLFSQAIPGRVGYQCSNFYRKLIKDGVVKDELYKQGQDGRLHFKERQSYHKKPWFEARGLDINQKPEIEADQTTTKKRVRKTRKASDEDSMSDEDVNSSPSVPISKIKLVGFYQKMAEQNPLPDQCDFITGEAIKVPAISPDGSVLDYNTWLNILKTSRQDPFTLKHVTKRQLVILTQDNYNEFKDKIKHL